jgi:hypothetical protein
VCDLYRWTGVDRDQYRESNKAIDIMRPITGPSNSAQALPSPCYWHTRHCPYPGGECLYNSQCLAAWAHGFRYSGSLFQLGKWAVRANIHPVTDGRCMSGGSRAARSADPDAVQYPGHVPWSIMAVISGPYVQRPLRMQSRSLRIELTSGNEVQYIAQNSQSSCLLDTPVAHSTIIRETNAIYNHN